MIIILIPSTSHPCASYERQGLLRDPGGRVFRSAGRLEIPSEDGGRLRDVISSSTPEFSTGVDELVMVQTMTDIAHGISLGRYNAVGITGSSSRDIVFLAQLVRKYSPDTVIFTSKADLLFTKPQTITDLRGMLVGSTYPLYAPNRRWSYPYGAGPRVFFGHDSVQAYYNGTMAVLREVFSDDAEIHQKAIPLEYSRPFQPPGAEPRPPIWIGVVGNRGLYPLHVSKADVGPATGASPLFPGDALKNSLNAVDPAFRPSYHTFWIVLEGLLLFLGAVLLAIAVLELLWVIGRIRGEDLFPSTPGGEHRAGVEGQGAGKGDTSGPGDAGSRKRGWRLCEPLALFLVWSRDLRNVNVPAGAPLHSSAGHGPGIFLVLTHLVYYVIFLAVNWPFLINLDGALASDGPVKWEWLARLGAVVAVVSLLVSVLSWFLLAVETRPARKWPLWVEGAFVALVLGASCWLWREAAGDVDAVLALERIVTVTSGVSPTFPMMFVGLGASAFLAAQFRRRYLNEQFHIKELVPRQGRRSDSPADPVTQVEMRIDGLMEVLHKPLRVFRRPEFVPTLLLAVYLGTLGLIGLRHVFEQESPEGPIFFYAFWAFFTALSGFLAFYVYLVFSVWGRLKEILGQLARLPLTRSFERMPTRVAGWFFERPKPGNRSLAVETEARALADRCEQPRVRAPFERLCRKAGIGAAEWEALPDLLRRINEPSRNAPGHGRDGWKSVRDRFPRLIRFLAENWAYIPIPRDRGRTPKAGSKADRGSTRGPSTDRVRNGLEGRRGPETPDPGGRGGLGVLARAAAGSCRGQRDVEQAGPPGPGRNAPVLDLRRGKSPRQDPGGGRRGVADHERDGAGLDGSALGQGGRHPGRGCASGPTGPRTSSPCSCSATSATSWRKSGS